MGRDNLYSDSQGNATQLAIRGDFGQGPDESISSPGPREIKMTSTTLALGEEEKLGQFLRRERTRKGIFLSEVSEKTCVRTYYLESIEEGDFKKLPPSLIARGFVRAYANYVGVDEDAAAQLFDDELSCQVSEEESSETLKPPLPTGGVIRRIEGALLWLLPQKRRPAVDLGDFMDQIQGFSHKERTPR